MRKRRAIAAMIVLLVLLGACTPAGGPKFTVGGQALAGPVCPVERTPPDPSCAPRPVVGAVLVIADAAGHEVSRTSSGSDGRWTTQLAAGAYTLTPQAVSGLVGTPPALEFTVDGAAPPIHLDVAYDTGIR